MYYRLNRLCIGIAALFLAGTVNSQTSQPGNAIDLEVYNPSDMSNTFIVDAGTTFWANVFVRPVDPALYPASQITCDLTCGSATGGPASIAAAVISLEYDPTQLLFIQAETSSTAGATDGLLQLNRTNEGLIRWVLAGDWEPDGDMTGTLVSPCIMEKLEQPGWLFRAQFQLIGIGPTTLHLSNESDGFPLSFADICGSPAFTESNGGIDDVFDAIILLGDGILFSDGFESGDAGQWTTTAP